MNVKNLLSGKSPGFWAWTGAAGLGAVLFLATGYALIAYKSAEREEAVIAGQRLTVSLATNEIFGNPRTVEAEKPEPAPSAETPPAPPPVKTPPPVTSTEGVVAPDASATPNPDIGTYVNPEQPQATPPEGEALAPAARIPPRDNPEVTETTLPPPAGTQPPAAETAAPAAEIAAPVATDATQPATPAPEAQTTATTATMPAAAAPPAAPAPAAAAKPDTSESLALPKQDMIEKGDKKDILLPTIGKDGEKPWEYYARPFKNPGNKPMVAIALINLGHSKMSSEAALGLPNDITFVFSPYAGSATMWVKAARAQGHEVMVELPMEPLDYPASDPGSYALLSDQPDDENLSRLQWAISRSPGFIGAFAPKEEKLTNNAKTSTILFQELERRGMMLLSANTDNGGLPGLIKQTRIPGLIANEVIDVTMSPAAIQEQLANLETAAKARGYAVGIAHPYPITLTQLNNWIDGLAAKGIVLAPVSAVMHAAEEQ